MKKNYFNMLKMFGNKMKVINIYLKIILNLNRSFLRKIKNLMNLLIISNSNYQKYVNQLHKLKIWTKNLNDWKQKIKKDHFKVKNLKYLHIYKKIKNYR